MRTRKLLTLFASAFIAISLVGCDAKPVEKDLPNDTSENVVSNEDPVNEEPIKNELPKETEENTAEEELPIEPDKKGTAREDLSPLQIDMMNYVTLGLKKTNPLTRGIDKQYNDVVGENYTDDETMHEAIKRAVIPTSEKRIETAETIVPDTKEVQEIHELYLTSLKTEHSSYTTMATALETQNADLIEPANELMHLSEEQMKDFDAALKDLGDKHDIRFE